MKKAWPAAASASGLDTHVAKLLSPQPGSPPVSTVHTPPAAAPAVTPAPVAAPIVSGSNPLVNYLVGLFLFFVVFPWSCSLLTGSPPSKTGIPTFSSAIVTKVHYDSIQNGMSYSQVASVIGN